MRGRNRRNRGGRQKTPWEDPPWWPALRLLAWRPLLANPSRLSWPLLLLLAGLWGATGALGAETPGLVGLTGPPAAPPLVVVGRQSPPLALGDKPWSKVDVALESSFWTLYLVDWAQTRYIAKNGTRYTRIWAHWEVVDGNRVIIPTCYRYEDYLVEKNPLLGRHPSLGRVDAYFALSGLLHVALIRTLPEEWRRTFLVSSVALEAFCVGNNIRLGIKFQ